MNSAAVAAGGLAVGSTAGMSTNNVTNEAMSTSSTGLGTANDVISFSGMRVKTDSQQVSISTVDAQGALQSTSITLSGDASKTTTYAGNIDKAISNINAQLQGTGNAVIEEHRRGEGTECRRNRRRHPLHQFRTTSR